MNVAYGGTLQLWQRCRDPGPARPPEDKSSRSRSSTHRRMTSNSCRGGLLRRIAGTDRVTVNSLHAQGVDRLAPGCRHEAQAPDGLVEVFRSGTRRIRAAVQWHPSGR